MNEKVYYQVEVQFENRESLEMYFPKVQEISEESFCDGIEEFDLSEQVVDEVLGERSFSGGDVSEEVLDDIGDYLQSNSFPRIFKFFFYEENSHIYSQDFCNKIKDLNINYHLESKKFEDWNEEWKKDFKPIKISDNLEIVPIWMQDNYQSLSKKFLYINPAMAFGTGGHETTQLCLKAIDAWASDLKENFFKYSNDYSKENINILDFGTGSGILGISCILLLEELILKCKTTIDFLDVESESIKNCQENLQLNLSKLKNQNLIEKNLKCHFILNNKSKEITEVEENKDKNEKSKYNLILANILKNVLLEEAGFLIHSLSDGGDLIVSGLLNDQVLQIQEVYEKYGIMTHKVLCIGDWSMIWFKRK